MRTTIISVFLLVTMFILALFFTSSVTISDYTSITLSTLYIEDITPDEINATGVWTEALTNITDGNLDSYGYGSNGSNTILEINLSKYDLRHNDSTSASLVQIKYNTTTGLNTTNFTLSDCWGGYVDKLVFRFLTNDTWTNISNSVSNESSTLLYHKNINLTESRIASATVFLESSTTVTNESDATNLVWGNNTNMTLDNDDVVSLVNLYRCNDSVVIGSGNYTLFALEGKIQCDFNDSIYAPDTSPICVNYTYGTTSLGSGNYTVNYQEGSINLTGSVYYNNTGYQVNYTHYTDSTPKNDRWCNNGSEWLQLGSTEDAREIYDVRMNWYIPTRTMNFSFVNLSNPSEYDVETTSSITFNWTTNDMLSDVNHSTYNCSIYSKVASGNSYSLNVSDVATINNTATTTTFTVSDGERIWWYLSCEDEYARVIGNSSMRIFDVDIDYMVLSLGVDQTINFTLDTGDVAIKRNLDVGGNINITGNLRVGGCIVYNYTGESKTLGVCV